ncbi:MAG TPA: LacI family transcriptional regulator [Flavobacteriia bacterium]|nr:LacI family transcriptional regulator [Flavobacteriia bacterium]
MSKQITLKDIAKELNVSVSTVSKALKDSKEISKKTKEKIQAFANFYHYKPNALALKLRNKKTMIIGVIIPEIVHHFFTRVISGIESVVSEKGYNLMICLSNESYDKEVLNLNLLTDGSVDGVILSLSKETLIKNNYQHLTNIIEDDIPLVLFDRAPKNLACNKILADDIYGGYIATNYFIKEHLNKIAIITTTKDITVGFLRKEGYLKALKENNIPVNERFIIEINDAEKIEKQIEKLFIHPNDFPKAIFAVNEVYAATAMKIIRSKNLKIPDDISVIGFTDGLISEFSEPPLTTVDQHGYNMGREAAKLLLSQIKNPSKPIEEKIVNTNLIIRKSTKNSFSN